MKNSFLFSLFVFGSTAWGTHYANYGGVPVDRLCDAGDHFQTISPLVDCAEWAEGSLSPLGQGEISEPQAWSCARLGEPRAPKIPKEYLGKECVEYSEGAEPDPAACLRFAQVKKIYPNPAYKVTYKKKSFQVIPYLIPDCGSL